MAKKKPKETLITAKNGTKVIVFAFLLLMINSMFSFAYHGLESTMAFTGFGSSTIFYSAGFLVSLFIYWMSFE
jgi:hypothetical protein